MTVSQLNRYMSFKVKEDVKLRGLLIKGEISGFTNHVKTGHFYFTLKDGTSAVKAIMFSSFASRMRFMPENGMSVIVMGSIQVFERDGVYQLYATDMQPDGLGAAYLAIEQLKERLSAEGIFDQSVKKPLPRFPSRVGIVTAKGGAALQDVLNILGRRYPICEAVVFPCLVQGEYAVGSVCEALAQADESGCDVIICGRGGGSPEDLAAFNSEQIARQIFAMNTPVISAVGHETDASIADLAADLRAPTPSAAAELAVPDMQALRDTFSALSDRLDKAYAGRISQMKQQLLELEYRLRDNYPAVSARKTGERLTALEEKLDAAMKMYISSKEELLARRAAQLDALSPLKILSRGYSLVYKDGELVSSVSQLKTGDGIALRFADGMANATISHIEGELKNEL